MCFPDVERLKIYTDFLRNQGSHSHLRANEVDKLGQCFHFLLRMMCMELLGLFAVGALTATGYPLVTYAVMACLSAKAAHDTMNLIHSFQDIGCSVSVTPIGGKNWAWSTTDNLKGIMSVADTYKDVYKAMLTPVKIPCFEVALPISNLHFRSLMSIPGYLEAMSGVAALPGVYKEWAEVPSAVKWWKHSWSESFFSFVSDFNLPTIFLILIVVCKVLNLAEILRHQHKAKKWIPAIRFHCGKFERSNFWTAFSSAAAHNNLDVLSGFSRKVAAFQAGAAEPHESCVRPEVILIRICLISGCKLFLKVSMIVDFLHAGQLSNTLVFTACTGFITYATGIPNQMFSIWGWMEKREKAKREYPTTVGQMTRHIVEESLVFAVTIIILIVLLAKVSGIWICSSYTLNLTSGCVD
jgi:hypothetical protein